MFARRACFGNKPHDAALAPYCCRAAGQGCLATLTARTKSRQGLYSALLVQEGWMTDTSTITDLRAVQYIWKGQTGSHAGFVVAFLGCELEP